MKQLLSVVFLSCTMLTMMAQTNGDTNDHIMDGLTSVARIGAETKTVEDVQDSTSVSVVTDIPVWKQKLYYGYKFDIYYHNDTRSIRKENGWSISVTPELGWKVSDRVHLGMRLGGSYQNTATQYSISLQDTVYTADLRVHEGAWEVAPYVRYRLKTLFNDKVGIWIEAHLYTGMNFPNVVAGDVKGTDYDGLRYSVTYGAQVSPVITYQFNSKSTFQIFFSILSLGYSGTTFFYNDPVNGNYTENTNDVILFSGKLRNLIANQFTPGLYGLRFGVQKSF